MHPTPWNLDKRSPVLAPFWTPQAVSDVFVVSFHNYRWCALQWMSRRHPHVCFMHPWLIHQAVPQLSPLLSRQGPVDLQRVGSLGRGRYRRRAADLHGNKTVVNNSMSTKSIVNGRFYYDMSKWWKLFKWKMTWCLHRTAFAAEGHCDAFMWKCRIHCSESNTACEWYYDGILILYILDAYKNSFENSFLHIACQSAQGENITVSVMVNIKDK